MLVLPSGVSAGLGLFCLRSGDWCSLGPPCRSQATSHLVLRHHREEEAVTNGSQSLSSALSLGPRTRATITGV